MTLRRYALPALLLSTLLLSGCGKDEAPTVRRYRLVTLDHDSLPARIDLAQPDQDVTGVELDLRPDGTARLALHIRLVTPENDLIKIDPAGNYRYREDAGSVVLYEDEREIRIEKDGRDLLWLDFLAGPRIGKLVRSD